MIQIENTIISDDIVTKKFACNLHECKGACCILGDSGAPVEADEIALLKTEYQNFKPFMRPEGIKAVEESGFYYTDSEFDTVTMLINGKECAYTYIDPNGIAYCAIEKAYLERKTVFRKPISCRLYPIRVKQLNELTAVNHNEWDICKPAVVNGEIHQIKVFEFLKEPLIANFGKEWFEQLKFYVENYNKIH
jgi:hypothetical protein